MSIIKVENLSKVYKLGVVSSRTLSGDLNRWISKVRGKEDPYLKLSRINELKNSFGEIVWALNDINFEVEQGQVIGIIGSNGAGKSTLLKILSRVTYPTKGQIKVKGRVASLLEIGTGFHPDLTGRENIFLNGSLLGMSKTEIRNKLDEIIDFSGIERYIDTPVKRYSSGMYVRLAFAVVAHLEPEILVVDEVLAVGDVEFQRKCLRKMKDVSQKEGRTVLIVSHQMGMIARLCETSILLDRGQIETIDKTSKVIEKYIYNISKQSEERKKSIFVGSNNEMSITDVMTTNLNGKFGDSFAHTVPIVFNISMHVNKTVKGAVLSLFVKDKFERKIFFTDFKLDDMVSSNESYFAKVEIPGNFLKPGEYSAGVTIHLPNIVYIDLIENACFFSIIDVGSEHFMYNDTDHGCVFVKSKWRINKSPVVSQLDIEF